MLLLLDPFVVKVEHFQDHLSMSSLENCRKKYKKVNYELLQNLNIITTHRSCHQDLNEDKVSFMLRFPSLLQTAINSSNMRMIREVIDQALTADFASRTICSKELIGRKVFYESISSMLQMVPDLCMTCSKPKLVGRTMTFEETITGTICKMTGKRKSEILVNPFTVPLEDLDNNLQVHFANYRTFSEKNIYFGFKQKVKICLFLNDSMSHIEKRDSTDICSFSVLDSSDKFTAKPVEVQKSSKRKFVDGDC